MNNMKGKKKEQKKDKINQKGQNFKERKKCSCVLIF